ncbi:MAG TPA: YfcE family phosphodiesterase, partial [Clostridia bacterium]|nr:YfcE family phosphodiesterase [Clostridia bacterium]
MKSIIAFSDSHGYPLTPAFEQILDETDYIFFLGDGLQGLSKLFVKDNFYAVKGNCDYMPFDEEMEVEVENVKFFLTHGNRYGVSHDNLNLLYRAKEISADCVLYGHTHIASIEKEEGILFINPGSISTPRISEPSYV